MYALRDALVTVLDDAPGVPVDDVTQALVTLLVAHVVAEQLDPKVVAEQFLALAVMGAAMNYSVGDPA